MNKTMNESNKENFPWYMEIFDENLIKEKIKENQKLTKDKREEERMTYRQNVKAILECIFVGFKDELIEVACERICELKEFEINKIRVEIEALEYLNIEDGSDGYDKYIEQYEVLKIIDKYREESEEQNGNTSNNS